MHDFENERGASDNPQPPVDDGLSLIDREILEFFETMELKYGLRELDLPWDILRGLTRHMSRNLHPVLVAEYCSKAASILTEISADYESIATDAKTKRYH